MLLEQLVCIFEILCQMLQILSVEIRSHLDFLIEEIVQST